MKPFLIRGSQLTPGPQDSAEPPAMKRRRGEEGRRDWRGEERKEAGRARRGETGELGEDRWRKSGGRGEGQVSKKKTIKRRWREKTRHKKEAVREDERSRGGQGGQEERWERRREQEETRLKTEEMKSDVTNERRKKWRSRLEGGKEGVDEVNEVDEDRESGK